MNLWETEINGNYTIVKALEILMLKVNAIANSDDVAQFNYDNPSWSTLLKTSYKPYNDALEEYEDALKINEQLFGKNPENGNLTIREIFINLNDIEKLSLFNKRINTEIPNIFEAYLQAWWMNRY